MMTEAGWSEERSTAMHEAGHAVASWVLDKPFRKVTVVADDHTHGLMQPVVPKWFLAPDGNDAFTMRHRRWMETQIIITMAGEVAEQAFDARHSDELPSAREASYDEHCHHDRPAVYDLLSHLDDAPEAELNAYMEWLRQRTISLVGSFPFRPASEALADELQRVGNLSWTKAKPVMVGAVGETKTLSVVDGKVQLV